MKWKNLLSFSYLDLMQPDWSSISVVEKDIAIQTYFSIFFRSFWWIWVDEK